MKKNVLLTTLGNTFDYSRHDYFSYHNGENDIYCEGISTAEAGAKYILSKVPIDRIIVLGQASPIKDENTEEALALKDLCSFGAAVPESYSEYKFFCYRIMQFLNQVDIEGTDLLDDIDEDERKEVLDKVNSRLFTHGESREERRKILNEVFHDLDLDHRDQEKYINTPYYTNQHSARWLKHYFFMRMDKKYKMTTLSSNEDITVRFFPTVEEAHDMRLGNLPNILDYITEGTSDEVNVYVDLQGMDIADSHTLISVLFMLQNERKATINIQEIITTTYQPYAFTNPIEDQKSRLELSELLSGMDSFLQYGKVSSIRKYWASRNIKDEHIEKMLYAMQTVDTGITLCNVSIMEYGIKMLKKVIDDPQKPSEAIESMIFNILETGILHDYGSLLQGDEINILALIKWAVRKHFYQQAITIIESRIPYDMVSRGVFYYCRGEEDKEDLLRRMNEVYWAAPPKDRYQFDDLEHYFVKFYRRREVYQKKPKDPMKTYVATRVAEVYDENSKVKSFSLFRGKPEVLEEFMSAYLNIGNMRNHISHAEEIELDYQHWNLNQENKVIVEMEQEINDFVKLYEKVRSGINKSENNSLIIGQEELKGYFKSHILHKNKNKNNNTNNNADPNGAGQENPSVAGSQNNQQAGSGQNAQQDGSQSNQQAAAGQNGQQSSGFQNNQQGGKGQNTQTDGNNQADQPGKKKMIIHRGQAFGNSSGNYKNNNNRNRGKQNGKNTKNGGKYRKY